MSEIRRRSVFDNVPNLQVQVLRVSTDPDTDRETTVEIKGQELQSTDGVCRLQYVVSKKDTEIRVNLLNRNALPAHIRAVFVLTSSEEEPVNSLGDSLGIVELQNCVLTQNGQLLRDYWTINVPPTRETIRIYDKNSNILIELMFQNSD